jgi:hypothetical protein
VATRDLTGKQRALLYGSGTALCLVMIAALASDFLYMPLPAETRTAEALPTERNRERARVAPSRLTEPAPDPSTYGIRQIEEAAVLVGDARRLALDGRTADAEAALAAAEKAAPLLPATAEARREVAGLATPGGRLERLLLDAGRAVERDDAAAARTALDAAASIDPTAPELAPLRQRLDRREAELARRNEQIATLLMRMREALARRDFAGAYRAVNEAERIDVTDVRIDAARLELDRAQAQAR